MPEFVHLHNHTHFSLLDAACTPDQLIAAAIADGQKSIALTDHGVMFGAMEFYKKAKKAGIKPIIGFEAYVANGSRFEKIAGKSKTKKRNYFHLILLAKNQIGYQNLIKLTTLGHTEGYYYKPRIDEELLEKYHEGIVASSACIAGVVNAHIVNGDLEMARKKAIWYKDLFGEDFYMELQNHNLPEDPDVLREAPKLARELGIKIVATNDVHYIKQDHAVAHNVLLHIKDSGSQNGEETDIYTLRYRTAEMYFKSQAQMIDLFRDFPESIETTTEIADKCTFEFDNIKHMPEFPLPEEWKDKTLDDYLKHITDVGLNKRFEHIDEDIRKRLDYELSVICQMGFAGYFLIVQDFINAAHENNVSVGPGRGSAAGSLVAYCLGITNVNPLPYNLQFERFLNPNRVTMPDIDIDFSDEKREVIINYVKKKYGEKSVSQIITFGKLSSRAVLKDVGRVLGIPHTEINAITAKIPVEMGKVKQLSEALEMPDLKWIKDSDNNKIKELIEYSLILENFYRNTSIHAAGVVIAPGEVSDFVPLYQSPTQTRQGADYATQYSMNDLEDAGLLKMDFLGLRTLSIIDRTLDQVEKNHGIRIDLDKIDFSDEKTYQMLSNGNTLAIFQFESKGMQDYLRQLSPKNLEEITAMNALYRPGPMENIPDFIECKHGRKSIEYLHPLMAKSLNNTYGVIVYQEQVTQLAVDIGGFTLGEADVLRRAMSKKKQSEMDKMKPQFIEGAEKQGINRKVADEIYELIYKFSNYGFNKSHSLAYSYLAFQTAWLKTYYTAEFLAANMTAELTNLDKIVQLIEEADKFNIKVVPPDINRSFAYFNATENEIIFGLAGIKNVGVSAVESVIKAREEKPFKTFFDFVSRVDNKLINKRALEALICAGAFDTLKMGHRAQLFAAIEPALDYARAVNDNQSIKMDSLFGSPGETTLVEPSLPKIREWTEKERLDNEKAVLNFYVSGHPLSRFKPQVESLPTLKLGDYENRLVGESVRVCGIITSIRTRFDKRQNQIAFIELEDFTGRAECILWSEAYSNFKDLLKQDEIVMIIGKSELDNEKIKVVVDEVIPISKAVHRFARGINLMLDTSVVKPEMIDSLFTICKDSQSRSLLAFNINDTQKKQKKQYIAYDVNLALTEDNIDKISKIFGINNVRLVSK